MHSFWKISLALLLALTALEGMKWRADTLSAESLVDQRANDVTVRGLASVGSLRTHLERNLEKPGASSVLWLGNSQLHSIIDYRPGDFLVNHWVSVEWPERCRPIDPTVVSLPSSNPQEHFVLSHVFAIQRPIDLVVIGLTFNDFRQDGIRAEFSDVFTEELHSILSMTSTGRMLLGRGPSVEARETTSVSHPIELEQWFSHTVLSAFPLWDARASLKELLLKDVLKWRNWTFGIRATDVRKAIRPRYDANMQALEELLGLFEEARVPVVAYITPIRHDYPLPYDVIEYQTFKEQAKQLTLMHSFSFLDLDDVIPNEMWSSHEIDYMHFKGDAHRLLASHVLPETTRFACDKVDHDMHVHRRLLNKTPSRYVLAELGHKVTPTNTLREVDKRSLD